MSIPEGESIQESLERLSKAQSARNLKDAGTTHAQTVRDAQWLRRVTLGFCLGFLAAFLALIVASAVEPDPKDFNWLGGVFALGCAAMIATFLVNAAWMIMDFPRWRRATRGYVNDDPIHNTLERGQNEAETRAASEPVASAPATLRPPAQYSAFGPRSARFGGWAFLFCAPDGVYYRRWYSWRVRVIPWQDVAGAFTYVTAGADGYSLYGVGIRMTGGGNRVKYLGAWGDNTAQDAADTIEAWREYYGPRVPATRERSDGDAS